MAPIADANKIPMISPSSTNPRVTKDGGKTRPYIFRVCFIDPFQGTVMAKFATENLKVKNVAVLRDVGNDYSVGLADFFSAKFKELGGKIVADQSYKAGDQDFKAQLTAIKTKKPEAIYVPGYYTDVGLIARQARELGIKVPLMGGDGWDSAKLYEIARRRARRLVLLEPLHAREPGAGHPGRSSRSTRRRTATVPDALAAMGYDAAMVAIDAMQPREGPLRRSRSREAIEATKDFKAVTGDDHPRRATTTP